jgi:hypothetical protein
VYAEGCGFFFFSSDFAAFRKASAFRIKRIIVRHQNDYRFASKVTAFCLKSNSVFQNTFLAN